MAVDATNAVGAGSATSVTAAIRKASQVTGAKFGYLLATAKVESNLNPNAAAKTSSAGGLFQFIDRTWLGTLKEAGPLLGYSRHADAITRTSDGRYTVSDPAMRREIMALRQDPTANALMAGVFTNSNARHLTNKLGRAPTDGELYIAHFMGASGAARLIGMAENNPTAIAAQSFPTAARANRSIFFDKGGRARNLTEVAQNLSGRYDVARARTNGLEAADVAQGTRFVAETARVARAYQVADSASRIPVASGQTAPQTNATGERVFHNPYRAGERRQPVSTEVANLWTQKPRTSQQELARKAAHDLAMRAIPQAAAQPVAQTADAANGRSDETLGLFQDIKPDVRSLFTRGVRG
jgi:hypothetical protein